MLDKKKYKDFTEDDLQKALEEVRNDAPAVNIVKYDKTNFVKIKVVIRRCVKRAENVIDHPILATSIMFAVTAEGKMLPPYIVFKADNLWSTWTEHGPEGARYNRTKSGWFDKNIFEDWFFSIIIPYAKKLNGPLILIGDNLASHVLLRVITECREKYITFVLLLLNSTNLTLSLDVSKTLEQIEANSVKNILSGFRATGFYPLDKEQGLKRIPMQDRPLNEIQANVSDSIKDMYETARRG
ncbi:hypothetical protein NQ314_001037 [Rhamnusium bicolor]|uniref:DDE-1 domain-containing protein n=1 Tax=Rhamnusium bicolor TaxID=1586634 RepID=A0AAV8ZSX5_9CUCU|nr:hypothetical protein NQ314_001037 [Rhamnusium bicolor]